MADYIKRRGEVWWLQKRVPKNLAPLIGKQMVEESLQTTDREAAKRKARKRLVELETDWERLEGMKAITPEEVEEFAQREFHRTLRESEEQSLDVQSLTLHLDKLATNHGDPEGEHGEPQYRPDMDEVSEAIMWARVDAYNARIAALEGRLYRPREAYGRRGVNPLSLAPVKPRRVSVKLGALRFSDLSEGYLEERQRDENVRLNEINLGHHKTTFRLFKDFIRDGSLANVTRSDASAFLDVLGRLKKTWGRAKEDAKLTFEQLVQKYPASQGKALSNRTINRHSGSLFGLFKWARNRGHFEGENPFSDQARATPKRSKTTYKPYTVDELNALFSSEPWTALTREERTTPTPYTFKNAFTWLPLITAFTGARSGEICQMMKHDIEEVDGIAYFLIRAEESHQSVKTDAGVRLVPIHSELIKAGLLEYWRALPDGQLFPALKPKGRGGKLNKYFGDRYRDHLVKIGVKRERLNFHSFRTNVGTALENAGVAENVINRLIGHEQATISLTTYSEGISDLQILQKAIEKVEYKNLKLEHLYQ